MRKVEASRSAGIKEINSKESCQDDLAIHEFVELANSRFGGFPACDLCDAGKWKTAGFRDYWAHRKDASRPSPFVVRCPEGHSRSLIGLFRLAPAFEGARRWAGTESLPRDFSHRIPAAKCRELAKGLANGKVAFPIIASRGSVASDRVQAGKLNELLSRFILGAPVPTSHLGPVEVIGGASLSRGVASSLVHQEEREIFQFRSRGISFYAKPLKTPTSEQFESVMTREARFKDYDRADISESKVRRGYLHVQRTRHRKGWWFQTKDLTERPKEIRAVLLLVNALARSNLGSLRGKSRHNYLSSTICYAGIQTLVRGRSRRAQKLRDELFEHFFMCLMLSMSSPVGPRPKRR